jgi:phosphoglycolate phosphatase
MGIDKSYRLYVFDLDGTVADTREDLARAFTAALEEAGYPRPDMVQVTAAIGGGAEKGLFRLTGAQGEAAEPLLESFLEKYGGLCTDHTAAYPGVCELLERLAAQGAVLALVTMKAKAPTHKILAALGLDALFDDVIAFEDVLKRKPDPESLLMLMEKYGVSPQDTLMVGDAATDIQYAAAAGADACAMLEGYGDAEALLAEKPKYALRSLTEF